MPYPCDDNVEELRQRIEEWIADNDKYAIVLKETDKVIGDISLEWSEKDDAYEIGYNITAVSGAKDMLPKLSADYLTGLIMSVEYVILRLFMQKITAHRAESLKNAASYRSIRDNIPVKTEK